MVQLPLANAAAKAHGMRLWAGPEMPRSDHDVIISKWCTDELARLNPWATAAQVADGVRQIEMLLASTTQDNLVENARTLLARLRTGVVVKDRTRGRSLRIIDFDDPRANRWDVATEVSYRTSGGQRTARFDIVIFANGIPLVVAETKSMVDPHASWLDAAADLSSAYTRRAPAFLAAGIVQVATDGREVRYGALRCAPEQFQRWGTTTPGRPADDTFEQVVYDFLALTDPVRLCSWAQDLILHLSDRSTGVLTRYVPRWIQSEAAPLMTLRALDEKLNRGLLVHFQGSGKTLAMLMAANAILRIDPEHLVILVVDRLDLLDQHTHDFAMSDARRHIVEAETRGELAKMLSAKGATGIIGTTVHRFADQGVLSKRRNITVLVDEAHRTQGTRDAQLGGQMRRALPNATLLGLTGTPVSAKDRNTFEAFGCEEDSGMVLHRYTAADSIRDGTTVPLTIDRRRNVQTLQRDELDAAFAAYVEREELGTHKAEILAKETTRWDVLLKDPRRIDKIASDVAADLTANILPGGYGALLVVADREACVLYADKLKKLLSPGQVTALISGDKNDPDSFEPYVRDRADEASVVRAFADHTKPLKLLVVTSKLLTGFDAKNCLAIYIDKPMKGLTLFQAVTRVNRTWVGPSGAPKGFGVIVDYCGVAPEVLKSFDQSADDVTRTEVLSPTELVAMFRRSLAAAEKTLGGEFDWDAELGPLIIAAKRTLASDQRLWRMFRQNVHRAELVFETIPSNAAVRAERQRLARLVRILDSYGVSARTERESLMLAHGPAVRALVLAHTGAPERTDLDLVTLTAERVQELIGTPNTPGLDVEYLQSAEVLDKLRERLKQRMAGPHAQEYSSIARKLEEFASTVYVATVEGVQQATLDLVEIARQMKAVDDLVGEQWEDLDLELFGWVRTPEPLLDPRRALQQILDEYSPAAPPTGLEDIAQVLDDLVGTLSYRSLLDDVAAQKQLQRMLLSDCKRLGILPADPAEAREFVTQLVAYVNAYLV